MRRERRLENEKQLRQSRMGAERRVQMLAREQNRDISEKVALGLAKPTASSETMFDSRLFNQSSGFDAGFNEDQAYDKPLFAAQDAIGSIYRPKAGGQDDDDFDEDDGGKKGAKEYERINKASRFEVLGKAKEGFKGAADAAPRDGPVQFVKDDTVVNTTNSKTNADDPFGIDSMIQDVTGGKRYGIQDQGREEEEAGRRAKRARIDEEEDD